MIVIVHTHYADLSTGSAETGPIATLCGQPINNNTEADPSCPACLRVEAKRKERREEFERDGK